MADSLEHILRNDPRVVSVASFVGCASPRFQTAYAPQIAGTNFAQFIVNTVSNQATEDLLNEYAPKYTDYFPEALVRFKQLSYNEATYPVEVRLSGENIDTLRREAEKVTALLRSMPELVLVSTNFNDPLATTRVVLKEDEATRLGISNVMLETTLAMRYGSGIPVATVWEGDYDISVKLKNSQADSANSCDLEDELIPVAGGLANVPLRQVADVVPAWENGQIVRRNGIYTITVMADLQRGENGMDVTGKVQKAVANLSFSPDVTLTYGGDLEDSEEKLPPILTGLLIAAAIIYFILLIHFRNVNIALLIFACMTLCVFGTAVGVLVQGVDFGVTSILGVVSLMGIIVRNGIIMIDYAEELRKTEKLGVRDAIYHSARRRMRPIFLTSAAASMGVIPMILGGSGLWMPMGTVICYGTLITMVFLLTVLPVCYWFMFSGSTHKRIAMEKMENE